jgi:hypothetical protein
MYIKEIQEFQKIRKEARAYFCYLMQRNIPNRLPNIGVAPQLFLNHFQNYKLIELYQ